MPTLNSYTLLSSLQSFLQQRGVEVEGLTADSMVPLMIDWFRLVRLGLLEPAPAGDVLVYRYGGWSEGCATGFRFSVLRRVTDAAAGGGGTDWYAGITLMFDPSRYADLTPLNTVSSDWKSVDAFLHAIESSTAFKTLVAVTPMSALLESGGVR
jgi:hypothetical protein